jgi:pimeloyl-ACP methyl ester carboxylesterase
VPQDQAAASSRAVICVDGIVNSAIKALTPDLGWGAYSRWLAQRRPDLAVAHLAQPHDWREILAGEASDYGDLVREMLRELLALRPGSWREVVVLGFSLGGLTALNVAHEFSRLVGEELQLDYLAYCSFGTPFGGTYAINDYLLRLLPISYLERIYARRDTLSYLRELIHGYSPRRLRILLHSINRDELVSRESALLPLEWLEFASPEGDIQWAGFDVELGRGTFGPHNSFPQHSRALAYVDGLVDGLLPPPPEADRGFEPFRFLPPEG